MNTQQQEQQQQQQKTITIYKMNGENVIIKVFDGMTVLDLSKQYTEDTKTQYFKYDIYEEGREQPLYNEPIDINKTYFLIDHLELNEDKMISVKNDYLLREVNKWIDNKDLIKQYEASDLADFTKYAMYEMTQEVITAFYDAVLNEDWGTVINDIDYYSLLEFHITETFNYDVLEASQDYYLYDVEDPILCNIFNDDTIEGEFFEELFKSENYKSNSLQTFDQTH